MFSEMTGRRKINATIITGFLGAGKTTFINHLLRKYPGKNFALAENEFGEVAIDTKLIKGIDASQLFELKNGCICCTITNEYELVLMELAEKYPHVDELLIETTGIADPGPVIRPFLMDTDLQKLYNFMGIVCLADAINHNLHMKLPVSNKQIICSGAIVISKTEGMTISDKSKLSGKLSKINPLAEYFFSTLEATDFDLTDYWRTAPKYFLNEKQNWPAHTPIISKTIYHEKPINRNKFENWLSYLLDVHRNEIYRVKGVVQFSNQPFEYIVQAVGTGWEIAEGELLADNHRNVLVFIGDLKDVPLDGLSDM